MKSDINRSKARVKLTIPRECIGSPRAVRVGVGVSVLRGETYFADDGLSPNLDDSEDFTFTPRVRRG